MDKKTEKAIDQGREQAAKDTAQRVEANSALAAPSPGEVEKAQKEGAAEAIKEAAKDTYQYLTDGNLASEQAARQWHGRSDIQQFAPLLSLGVEEFEATVSEDAEQPIPEEKVAGLLELERSGQNRTPYVQALCKRLKVKSPYEVTNAGPGYTNDVRPVTKL